MHHQIKACLLTDSTTASTSSGRAISAGSHKPNFTAAVCAPGTVQPCAGTRGRRVAHQLRDRGIESRESFVTLKAVL